MHPHLAQRKATVLTEAGKALLNPLPCDHYLSPQLPAPCVPPATWVPSRVTEHTRVPASGTVPPSWPLIPFKPGSSPPPQGLPALPFNQPHHLLIFALPVTPTRKARSCVCSIDCPVSGVWGRACPSVRSDAGHVGTQWADPGKDGRSGRTSGGCRSGVVPGAGPGRATVRAAWGGRAGKWRPGQRHRGAPGPAAEGTAGAARARNAKSARPRWAGRRDIPETALGGSHGTRG